MNKFKSFALNRPFLFGLVLIFIHAILGTLTYPAHFLFPESEVGQLYGDALSKFIIFLCFLLSSFALFTNWSRMVFIFPSTPTHGG